MGFGANIRQPFPINTPVRGKFQPNFRTSRTKNMHIRDILGSPKPSLSFEFFPPRAPAAWDDLYETIRDLETLSPSFVSVTYGAGGSTRELTHDLVVRIKETTSIPPVPHLTCVGHTRDEVDAILTRYAEAGVANILALRGDPAGG